MQTDMARPAPRVALICHHDSRVDLELMTSWIQSFATLAGIVTIQEDAKKMKCTRLRRAAAAAGVRLLFNSEPRQSASAHDGIEVCGRFSLMRGSTADDAMALATGRLSTLWRQRVLWDAKTVTKKILGTYFLRLREQWFLRRQ